MTATVLVETDTAATRHLLDTAMSVEGCRVQFSDPVELSSTAARLAALERQYRDIVEGAPDGLLVTDADGAITYANPAAVRIIGVGTAQLVSRHVFDVLPYLRSGQHSGLIRRRNGEPVTTETTSSTVEDSGDVIRVYVVRDLADRQDREEFAALASRDPLTGLWNRRHFARELNSRLSAAIRYGRDGALLFVEVDRFKEVNERAGHDAGDAVLRELGRLLERNTRESDLAARVGPNKFAVLLEQANLEQAAQCANKILELIRAVSIVSGDVQLSFTVSIAVTTFPLHGVNPTAVLSAADTALVSAKRHGGDLVCTP